MKNPFDKDLINCPACHYFGTIDQWSHLYIMTSVGDGCFGCNEIDFPNKESKHIEHAELLGCPVCRTVIWNE